MTWREDCADVIFAATKDLARDLPLSERIKVVDAARPSWVRQTSWGKKSWQAARRDYVVPFVYQPKTKKAAERRASVVSELPFFELSDGSNA